MVSRQMLTLTIALALVPFVHVYGESRYDQPCLGKWPSIFGRFWAQSLRDQADVGLPYLVNASELIILGAADELREIRVEQHVEEIAFYDSNVRVIRILKGASEKTSFHLRFEPSATGIESGARHVFFLRLAEPEKPAVLAAWYVYPDRYNLMRVAGAYNCSEDLGMDVLMHLITGKSPPKLASRLLAEYHSDDWGKMYSAVAMAAAATPEVGGDVLKKAVSERGRERFDLQLFSTAAHALAAKQGNNGLRVLLASIPRTVAYPNP